MSCTEKEEEQDEEEEEETSHTQAANTWQGKQAAEELCLVLVDFYPFYSDVMFT